MLDRIEGETLVFRDVESRYGNIDHILLHRDHGLFVIETKAHVGRVSCQDGVLLVNGNAPERNFVIQALGNALWIREQITATLGLDVWVTPVIVFANAHVESIRPIKGVAISSRKWLPKVVVRNRASREFPALWSRADELNRVLNVSPAAEVR